MAMESLFTVLFIITATGGIFQAALFENLAIDTMASSRALLEAAATEMTILGYKTHLVRLDYNVSTGLPDVYVFSEDCSKFRQTLAEHYSSGSLDSGENEFICSEEIYANKFRF